MKIPRDSREPVVTTDLGGKKRQVYSENGKRLVYKTEIIMGGRRKVQVEAEES